MINQFEFCQYLQSILDDNTLITDVVFDVRTPDMPFFDSMARKIETTDDPQITKLPVMVEQAPEGGYDPTPNLGLWDGTLSVSFLFPLADLASMERLYDYIAVRLSGKIDTIGDISGKCVMAVGQRSFGQMQLLDVGQFSQVNQQVMALYGKEMRITREWMTMSFTIDFASGLNVGGADGIIYGNQIKRVLSWQVQSTYGYMTDYSIELTLVDASSANSIMPFSQQYINGKETKSIASCSAKGVSFTCYVQDNANWATIIKASRNNTLNDNVNPIMNLRYDEYYETAVNDVGEDGRIYLFSDNVTITEIGFTGGYGEPMTCSMSLAPKGEVMTL